MSRDIAFYAVKNKDLKNKIELWWAGADSAQLLFDSIRELDYGDNSANYVEISSALNQMQRGLDEKISELVKHNQEIQSLVEEYRNAITKTINVDIFREIMEDINSCNSQITENQEEIDFYQKMKSTLITILSLEFFNARYDGTPSEWELYISYSY